MKKVAAVSGGFDPVHVGHLRMIHQMITQGYDVLVIVNSDDWLCRKKGFYFQDQVERLQIMSSIKGVVHAVLAEDKDDTVVRTLKSYQNVINVFVNGGDRGRDNTPEAEFCIMNGIDLMYGVGGADKANSSSIINTKNTVDRPWGHWEVINEFPGIKVKELYVDPGKSLSMQRHEHRAEFWTVLTGECHVEIGEEGIILHLEKGSNLNIPMGEWHRLSNTGDEPLVVLEVQRGEILQESDIERKEDVQ